MPFRKTNNSHKTRQFSYLATLIGLLDLSRSGKNLAIRKAANKDAVMLVQKHYGLRVGKHTPKPQLEKLDALKRRDHLIATATFRQPKEIDELIDE